ncbi:ABC transporter substrate-binding protein [Bailinhaonella thermotolerans]|uniref:ABC transporter substrate-binding protein n=1 Tax=Bailinhaonella thermotolerans TaxID=1070861 RepID=UPI001F5B032F|nr:ABC transporter substrate-binding protein [Bailinhaonella thermotolerans]
MTNRRLTALAAVVAAGALALAGCGGGGGEKSGGGGSSPGGGGNKPLAGVTLEVAAKWTGTEQENFQKVLNMFQDQTGATVKYVPTGEDTGAFLGPRIAAKTPPDIAILPQPGLVQEYAKQGALKPLSAEVVAEIDKNYSQYWKDLASADGKVYGMMVKAAHKSIVWYLKEAYDNAGVQPPQTFDQLVGETADKLAESGATPFSLCGASGWTLTDLFENVYLSQAGPENYDKLAKHELKWTDATVTKALQTIAKIKPDHVLGGSSGALQTDFPTCVTRVFGEKKAAMVIEADFVAATVSTTKEKVGEGAQFFPFPKAGDTAPVVLGSDIAVAMTEEKGAMELMRFLSSAEAATAWAKLGGYLSANKNVSPDSYPDALTKELGRTIQASADTARYDMSDLAPSAFGATDGKGEWKLLQDLLRNPGDVKGIQSKLESEAAKAFGGS